MHVYPTILGIELSDDTKGAYLNIRGALTQHFLDRDAIVRLYLISALCLRRLLGFAPAEKPVPAAQKCFYLIILPTPHRPNNPIAHDYVL